MIHWRDDTTYSRGDCDSIPTTWVTKIGELRIVVHRHIYSPADMWHVTCQAVALEREALSAAELENAKEEALATILDKINAIQQAGELIRKELWGEPKT